MPDGDLRIRTIADTASLKEIIAQLKLLDLSVRQGNVEGTVASKVYKDLETKVSKLTLSLKEQTQVQSALFQAQEHVRTGFVSMSDSLTRRVNPAMISFSQGIQDAGMFSMGAGVGIRSITNNVQMLGQQLLYLKSSGFSVGQIIRSMVGALSGPMGLLVAFSAVTAAIQYFTTETGSAEKKVRDLNEEYDKLIELQWENKKITDTEYLKLLGQNIDEARVNLAKMNSELKVQKEWYDYLLDSLKGWWGLLKNIGESWYSAFSYWIGKAVDRIVEAYNAVSTMINNALAALGIEATPLKPMGYKSKSNEDYTKAQINVEQAEKRYRTAADKISKEGRTKTGKEAETFGRTGIGLQANLANIVPFGSNALRTPINLSTDLGVLFSQQPQLGNFSKALTQFAAELKDSGVIVDDFRGAMWRATDSLANSFMGLVTGTMNLSNVFLSFGESILQMLAQQGAKSAMGGILGWLFPSTKLLEGKASGGTVGAGRSYIVGEHGAELLTMGASGGYITPNYKLSQSSYRKSGESYHVSVHPIVDNQGLAMQVIIGNNQRNQRIMK